MKHEPFQAFGGMCQDPSVRKLVDACCDGLATVEQRSELGRLIQSSPEVRDYYIAHSTLNSQLLTYADIPVELPEESMQKDTASVGQSGSDEGVRRVAVSSPVSTSGGFPHAKLWAIAASIALVIVGGSTYYEMRSADRPVVIGEMRLVNNDAASVGDASMTPVTQRQRVEFREGECVVALKNGVKLSLAGPASFDVVDAMRFHLRWGRMTAEVPEEAKGFSVSTRHSEVIDHGTRFGISVTSEGSTDVAVFEGEVDVVSVAQQRQLSVGKAVSVSRRGLMSRMSVVKPDSFETSLVSLGPSGPLVTSVKDNIRSCNEFGYYRIVNQGFGEDQPAYVDRVHQWNGIGGEGLPKELIGADYIMPFNEDKYVQQIEVTVTLARQADIYVLLDERVSVPDWLSEDYVQTEMLVGMDEGERPGRPEDLRTLGEGAGNSIDYSFSVWKRKLPAVGEVTLGGLSNEHLYLSMYGILAIPTPVLPPAI